MNNYILKKDHLNSFLRKLKKENQLVAPVRNRYGDTLFQKIDDLDKADIDLENQPQGSIKPFLFPQQEVLFKYSTNEKGDLYNFSNECSSENVVYFGVRSCDLSAILYMDVIFLKDKNKDPYYLERRKKIISICYTCNDPFQNCFCMAAKSGPFLECGFDLQFTDLGDRFHVETGTARGQQLVEKLHQFFRLASTKYQRLRDNTILESKRKFKQQVFVELACKKIADNVVRDEIWSKLSSLCHGCGGCAYICPTCTCYSVSDRKISEREGERLRSWDACTYTGFTRMAGNINPINMNKNRIRRRFVHKLHYDVLKHRQPSCVGCGRCVDMCFGGVDIVKFIQMINRIN